MALKSSVLFADAIFAGGEAGGGRYYTVEDPATNKQYTYREVRSSSLFRWRGCTEDAATTFVNAHANDSSGTVTVTARCYCDNEILQSYTVEYGWDDVQTYRVSVQDIPTSQGAGGTPPTMTDPP